MTAANTSSIHRFPAHFRFGVGTAAYPVEGAWRADGKSESQWDHHAHTTPARFAGFETGDVAADAYTRAVDDVAHLRALGVDFYRFSLAWCRILPTGFAHQVNAAGVEHYRTLILRLLDAGVQPMVTLYHWDLPQALAALGGWANPAAVDWFAAYARVCFDAFGRHVRMWVSIDSPNVIARCGYGRSRHAPFVDADGVGTYLAAHTLLLAHAKVYRMYKSEYAAQKGTLGIAIDAPWFEPYSTAGDDVRAAERMLHMYVGWIANPIFGAAGDYPTVMRDRVAANSRTQRFPSSRLPTFTAEEIGMLRGAADFFGVNHFSSYYVTHASVGAVPSNDNDIGAHYFVDDNWVKTANPKRSVLPWGLFNLLRWINDSYQQPLVIITGNGYMGNAQEDRFNDIERIEYIMDYLKEILRAINEVNCNVRAYTLWSFLDGFEWTDAYSVRSGLLHVDFNDPERKRHAKRSMFVYRNIISTRRIEIGSDVSTAIEPAVPLAIQEASHADEKKITDKSQTSTL